MIYILQVKTLLIVTPQRKFIFIFVGYFKTIYTMETFVNTSTLFNSKGKNDCTVRAFAVCMDCSYTEAEKYMAENLGRVGGKGIDTITLNKHLKSNVKTLFDIRDDKGNYPIFKSQLHKTINKNPTFNQFKRYYMDFNKTYYIIVNGHALAVKNGVIYGNENDKKIIRKRLWAVYEF